MNDKQETVRAALVDAYWRQPITLYMAAAAGKAAGVNNMNWPEVQRIIDNHLVEPNFITMAAEVTRELEGK